MNKINTSSLISRNTPYDIDETPILVFQTFSENVFFSDDGIYAAEKIAENSTENIRIIDISMQNPILCKPIQNLGYPKISYRFQFTQDNQFVILIRSSQMKSYYLIQNIIDNNCCREFSFDSSQFIQLWNNKLNIYLILNHQLTRSLQLYHIDQHMNIHLVIQQPQWANLQKIIHIDTLTQHSPFLLLANNEEMRLFCKFRLKGLSSIFVKEISHIKAYASKILILKPRYDSLQTHFYQLTCKKLIRKLTTIDYRNSIYQGRYLYLSNENIIYIYNIENGKLVIQFNILEKIENLRIMGEYLVYKNCLMYKGWKRKQQQIKYDSLKCQE